MEALFLMNRLHARDDHRASRSAGDFYLVFIRILKDELLGPRSESPRPLPGIDTTERVTFKGTWEGTWKGDSRYRAGAID